MLLINDCKVRVFNYHHQVNIPFIIAVNGIIKFSCAVVEMTYTIVEMLSRLSSWLIRLLRWVRGCRVGLYDCKVGCAVVELPYKIVETVSRLLSWLIRLSRCFRGCRDDLYGCKVDFAVVELILWKQTAATCRLLYRQECFLPGKKPLPDTGKSI